MNRMRALVVVVVIAAAGCGPEGPSDFYRDALQANSELVDSLTLVVDDETAKTYFTPAEKRYKSRMQDIREKLTAYKTKLGTDNSFRKLAREDFKINRIDEDVRDAMIHGARAYFDYTKNITYTNVRLGRELKRLQMVIEATQAKRLEEQLNDPNASPEPASVSNLQAVIDTMGKSTDIAAIQFIPSGLTVQDLQKLPFTLSPDELNQMMAFKNDINIKLNDLEPPPLPEKPAWVEDAFRRVLERNRALPALRGGGFSVAYADQMTLTNVSGMDLTSVNGSLLFELGGSRNTQVISSGEWRANEGKPFSSPPPGATKLRLFGTARAANANFQFDVGLPNPPVKKEAEGS